jgi:hypothetical protein
MAEHIGYEKLVMNHEDYDRSLDPQFGQPVDMSGRCGGRLAIRHPVRDIHSTGIIGY